MTVTHPHHPLAGQQVAVVRIRRGADPDLIVRLPDGRHLAIAQSWTSDIFPLAAPDPASPALPLLELEGLRQLASLIERLRQLDPPAAGPAGAPATARSDIPWGPTHHPLTR